VQTRTSQSLFMTMSSPQPQSDWTVQQSQRLYGIDRWSGGFFSIDDSGLLQAQLSIDASSEQTSNFSLLEIADAASERGLNTPLLIRFPDMLKSRVRSLQKAFAQARNELQYQGGYHSIYPIKVNQTQSVVKHILEASDQVGLEAGSKPELLATIAVSRPGGTIICNGFKDRQYIRLALIAQTIGLNVFLVVEKLSELGQVIQLAIEMKIRPQIGLRLRLASIGHGKWQNTGGDKAKFGLSPGQILAAKKQLEQVGMLDCLQLLHFHMGSQISNIRDISLGATEAAHYYAELSALNAPIRYLDVGGGLGVDYEGSGSRGPFSLNYSLDQYATTICRVVAQVCDKQGIPHPDLMTESGRALTAHHAVLITEVAAVEQADEGVEKPTLTSQAPTELVAIHEILQTLDQRPLGESLEEARFLFSQGKEKFTHGEMKLQHRADMETIFTTICQGLKKRLQTDDPRHQKLGLELITILADKYFCNLSVFRSIPDVWAIDQVFPILPLSQLDTQPDRQTVLEDLTCDSDGRIDQYAESGSQQGHLSLHRPEKDQRYLLGIFMVGAYQEILGDNHNLFARTHSLEVSLQNGSLHLSSVFRGDSAKSALAEVGYDEHEMLEAITEKVTAQTSLSTDQRKSFLLALDQNLDQYTYLYFE